MSRFPLAALLFALALSSVDGLPAAAQKVVPLPSTAKIALPPGASVRSAWQVPPGAELPFRGSPSALAVDPEGHPWYVYDGWALYEPGARLSFRLDKRVEDCFWLDDGRFLARSGNLIGTFGTKDAGAQGLLTFEPLLKLGAGEYRMYPGSGNGFYLVNRGSDKTGTQVLWLDWKRGEKVPAIRTLLALPEKVSALAGDGESTFLAVDKGVLLLKDKKLSAVFQEPKDAVLGLAYGPKAGLFFATAGAAGFVGPSGAVEFAGGAHPRVLARGRTAYLYLDDTHSLLAFEGADSLTRPAEKKP